MRPSISSGLRVCPTSSEPPAPDPGPPQRRVLFVTGDADLRAVASRVLARAGYDVSAVAHSGHALLRCRTSQFDVLVTELAGPDLSGPALAEQVRRHCPNLGTVFIASPGTPEAVENILVRPFTREDLIRRIQGESGKVEEVEKWKK